MTQSILDWVAEAQAYIDKQNKAYPVVLREIPREQWPMDPGPNGPARVLRSSVFLMQVYQEARGVLRLTVQRNALNPDGSWVDGISWDDLQALKREAGYADRQAVEVYPADRDVVNVSNLRHLWLLPEGVSMPFAWRRR